METVSFDPLLFWPSTIVDLIFNHLKGKEILNATKVSRSWETFIGESPSCMKKLDLTINGRKYFLNHRENELRDDLKLLSASERRYKNFTLYAQKPGFLTKDVMNLLIARKWKSIKVWSEKFEDENQLENFLFSIMESVEILELRNISLKTTSVGFESVRKFVFQRLKSLSLSHVACTKWLMKSLTDFNQLESLDIENESSDALIRLLEAVPTLKTLSLTGSTINDEFFHKLSRIQCLKLNTFKIKTMSAKISDCQNGLRTFFEMQADNITKLIIDTALSFEDMQTILRFSNLTTLSIMTKPDYQLVWCAINQSIVDLTINFDCNLKLISGLINSMVNLKIVKIPTTLYDKLGFQKKDERDNLFPSHLFTVEML